MKKFLTCALCFVPNLVMARTLYYTPGGECPGLYLNPATTGCPGDSDRVVKLNVAKRADANFLGYKIGNVEIVDSAGNVKDNAVNTLVAARTAGTITDAAKISGYECNQGIYGSNKNVQKNENGTCVVENSDEDSGAEYIRGDGTSVSPSNVNCWRNGKNYCYWNVNITFHSKPEGASLAGITDKNNGHTLTSDLQADGDWCKEYVQGACYRINMPTAPGYTFRGYYLGKINGTPVQLPSNMITGESTTDGGAFSVFYPKNTNAQDISVTGHRIVVMSDAVVNDPDTASIDVDVYGAWARNCDAGTNATCGLEIGTNWNTVAGFGKGDVRYNTSCADGFSVTNGGTYNPQCEKQSGILNLNYTYRDQYGLEVSACSVSGNSCEIHNTYYFGGSCSNGYTLKYFQTANGLHKYNGSVTCSNNVFGDCSSGTCEIIGYVCRNSCNLGDAIENGKCVSAYQSGGQIAGTGEVIENIFAGCNQITCNSGYKLTETTNGVECVGEGGGSTGVKGSEWLGVEEP